MIELPSFADLLLAPQAVDRNARAFMENNAIVVITQQPDKMLLALGKYPHVHLEHEEGGAVRIYPKSAPHRRVWMAWGNGRTACVFVWDDKFFSRLDPRAATDLIAAGYSFESIDVAPDTGIDEVLNNLMLH
jgi:hypothetical protein